MSRYWDNSSSRTNIINTNTAALPTLRDYHEKSGYFAIQVRLRDISPISVSEAGLKLSSSDFFEKNKRQRTTPS